MKRIHLAYWISTGLIALMMSYSAYVYFTPAGVMGFQRLGFPGYFRIELAVFKLIGAIGLLAPIPARIKEWVYAGFGIVFISAFIAHTGAGDPVAMRIMPLIFFLLLVVSYITGIKRKQPTLYGQVKKQPVYEQELVHS